MKRLFTLIILCLIGLSINNHLSKESTPLFSEDDEDEASEEEVAMGGKHQHNMLQSKK
jgi:hypothetical protein